MRPPYFYISLSIFATSKSTSASTQKIRKSVPLMSRNNKFILQAHLSLFRLRNGISEDFEVAQDEAKPLF